MLRRAASNAYSWWWASHVRTKQSKWLDENLQDIEEKVQYALKLLEDEGDSFAKRAEMYYKRRPELISFVEESFKAYRALAERYDHISKELQNANTTIASVFPDQVPEFAMNEDDYSAVSPRSRKTQTDAMLSSNKNVPKVPNLPMKDSEATKMFKSRLANNKEHGGELSEVVVNKSGLSKTEAVEEIDKLQKEILVLQTEKEFLFGARVDALLSENLNLLVRFSNSFGQIQQFDTGIKDLQVELMKIIDQKNQDKPSLRSNVRPIYKHLNEIRTELTIWLEKSLLLKEEINSRASTLNNIQNEITEALKTDSDDPETKFTIYQGAKFEGEVSNMQKENNRIAEELQTGLDQVEKLQREADKTLGKLSEEFSLSESKNRSSTRSTQDSKTSIPLRSFIFDVKPKKQRLSLFSCIQPSMSKKMRPDS
ncbi:hypothetical protein F2Q69_00045085 [Brassica cretica]|uniref:NAB domain-containing protein n=1 Tax=Brassica cretica TaxID=69181 RepID=A0A8S9NFG8_BRACR|nr:hypothetical protein F2Q69_00045085 [Brassica cretica]